MMQYDGWNRSPYPGGQNPYLPGFVSPVETLAKRKLRQHLNRMGWSLVAFAAFQFLIAFIFAAISLLFQFGNGISLYQEGSLEGELIEMAMYIPTMILPFLIYALLAKQPLREIPLSRPKGRAVYLGIPIAMAVCVLANVLSAMFSGVMETFGLHTVLPDTVIPEAWAGKIVFLIKLSVLPALAEELVFRGILMQPLRRYGDHFAVLVSAALFGLMHGNFDQIPFAFVVGLIIGFMVIKTGTLWTGIIIHFFNNFFSGVLSILSEYMTDQTEQFVGAAYYIVLLSAGLVCLVLLLKTYPDFFRLKKDPELLPLRQKIACAIGNPGIITAVCIFLGLAAYFVKTLW
ncbi:MAG: CPBP family intramembrane metalloprotease [Clostridiales bacterium]|nr:CPBP family intramembrane metalloprotease [Clostridiales bacterium]